MHTLSVIVCTYNSPLKLDRCLTSLEEYLPRGIEVVVIDNGSNEETQKVVGKYNRHDSSYKYFHTDKSGLAHARNLGWQKASGDYVAYIDDDAIVTHEWGKAALSFIKRNPRVSIFGGPYKSLNESKIPSWIPSELTSKILPGRLNRPINLGTEWLNGTNFVVKRSVLRVTSFDESLGVNADKRAYGEETDLQIRLYNQGHKVWYVPDMMVLHEFADFKMNMWYLLKNQFTHGFSSKGVFKNLKKSNKHHTATTILYRISSPNIPLKRRVYYLLAPFFYLLGIFWSRLRYN